MGEYKKGGVYVCTSPPHVSLCIKDEPRRWTCLGVASVLSINPGSVDGMKGGGVFVCIPRCLNQI